MTGTISGHPVTPMIGGAPVSDDNAVPVKGTLTAVIDESTLATQATLAAVLAKLSADPATQTTLAAILTALGFLMPSNGGSLIAYGIAQFPQGTLALRANATAYTSGKIIAQSATAGSCSGVALAVGRVNDGTGMLRRCRLKINDATWLNAIVRVHFFKDAPTFTNADAGTFAAGVSESTWLGAMDVTLDQSFSDPFVKGVGVPVYGSEINYVCSSGTQNIFYVLEARSTVTASASSKTFTLTAEDLPN